ncbi:hypothetical protein Athai_13860 [Actinocatenispora thailandica]|uniref:Aminoglycoside phosphotransferase domain-containing protein n=1 Tax=Actinocatenispora thailandica TaxID=227318 RepID=A0A7R7DLM6_9ACTN|nr:hypothetical protein Athai_13860 [Actinocatenispora thailandica]
MHPDEADIDGSLVARLLAKQFPQWADLSLVKVASAGTDNAIYRLGDDMAVRVYPEPPRWWVRSSVGCRSLLHFCRWRCLCRWAQARPTTGFPTPGRCIGGWAARTSPTMPLSTWMT